ncbi:MAG: hypothetical protein DLM68_14740 [Hyphomicrobiales bacterium]|nr:MAG: hypothetical protein DLM68_14740 [Hyphomicrobiales bacterium]
MIDLDEFERRLCRPCSTDQKDDDPLAELLRIIGGKDESHETDFEPKTPLSARARQYKGEPGELNQPDAQVRLVGGDFAAIEAGLLGTKQPQAAIPSEAEQSMVEYKRPNALAPLISGDFAAIEAGLLGAVREQATATVSETAMSNAFPSVDLGSERRPYQDNQPTSRHGGVADGQNRSRRPLYVMVAIVIVAMAGIAVSFGLKSQASGPPEIASIKADNGPDKQQTEATSGANVPAQEAAILSKPPEPSPMALVNGTERTLDLPQAEEKTLPAESHDLIDNRVPSAPAQAPTPAEPLSMAAPIESDTVKTDLVRPDDTLLPNGTPLQANINGAPLPAPQSFAAAKAPTAKAAGRVAKPLKPTAARHPGSHGHPRQIANKAKATPMSPLTSELAPSADPKAETPTTQPSPATNGAFGFAQSALNSLTSTTAKLFEWGRVESGSRP